MALVRCDFFSDVLELSTSMTVILPQSTSAQIGMSGSAAVGDPPVLYLLHGLSDDDTTWLRRTSVERYVARRSGSPSSCRRCTAASTPTRRTAAGTGPSCPRSCPP